MANAIFGKLTLEKWQLIQSVARTLSLRDYHLAAVIAFETGESFSPWAENPLSHAVGLIQFTATGLSSIQKGKYAGKYTMQRVKEMDFREQLEGPVADYLEANQAVGLVRLSDLYMSILAPSAIGKSPDHVLYKSPSVAYTQNKGLDQTGKGYITKADATEQVYKKLDKVLERLKTLEREMERG